MIGIQSLSTSVRLPGRRQARLLKSPMLIGCAWAGAAESVGVAQHCVLVSGRPDATDLGRLPVTDATDVPEQLIHVVARLHEGGHATGCTQQPGTDSGNVRPHAAMAAAACHADCKRCCESP